MRFASLNQISPYSNTFSFTSLMDPKVADAIVICNPLQATCKSPVFLRSKKSLEEHIDYVREHQIKKALVVADDIDFLRRCPSLEYLWVIPSLSAQNFDYSPLYDMPQIRWLQCETLYGLKDDKVAGIDYSKIHGLQRLAVRGKSGHYNVSTVTGLKTLYFDQGQPLSDTLNGAFNGILLENLSICQSPIRSLEGLAQAKQLRKLDLAYNKKLKEITSLSEVKETLVWLDIEKCSKIQDFSVLSELHNLEVLRLQGSNSIPDISFLSNMPKLKFFVLTMNVADGDLTLCERIPYVAIQNRKHYNHKDKDFSKASYSPHSIYIFER